jgi:hypothetical protein
VELMFCRPLFSQSPFLVTLFAHRAIDESSETIFNTTSAEQQTFGNIHCL